MDCPWPGSRSSRHQVCCTTSDLGSQYTSHAFQDKLSFWRTASGRSITRNSWYEPRPLADEKPREPHNAEIVVLPGRVKGWRPGGTGLAARQRASARRGGSGAFIFREVRAVPKRCGLRPCRIREWSALPGITPAHRHDIANPPNNDIHIPITARISHMICRLHVFMTMVVR